MAGGDDRLSQLPNDILRRVLHFAPLKEAASTTALSRRWRAPLWLSSAAVNLETGVDHYYYGRRDEDKARFFSSRDAFVFAAAAALDAADVPVTRLILLLESDLNESADDFLSWRRDMDKVVSRYTGLIEVALSHRAARRVEELRIVAKDQTDYDLFGDRETDRLYTVTLDSLPLETLRVLELANCKGLLCRREPAALVLPRLSSLRLTHCEQHLSSLQRVIDAAPVLAVVHLESVHIDATDHDDDNAPPPWPNEATTRRLRCPAVTVLVLDSSTWKEKKQCREPSGYNYKKTLDIVSMEIDAPRLRRFRYKGSLCSFSFSPQPLELERVDLEFLDHRNYGNNNEDAYRDLETFWRFAQRFTSTKEMRLRVKHLEDIAVLSEARRVELLPAFRRLERLEVQGEHWTKGKDAAMTILNLLRCCPVLAALRINLTAKHEDDASDKKGKEIQIAALLGRRHLFQCLQNSLTRVGLQFQLEKADCLGVKLIKFFAENAMVLKEMHVDGGDEKLYEDMNPKTEKWNSKRRKLGATSFVVLPL